jgi:hypothetical protein
MIRELRNRIALISIIEYYGIKNRIGQRVVSRVEVKRNASTWQNRVYQTNWVEVVG